MKAWWLATLLMTGGAGAATDPVQPAPLICEAPEFPAVSTSNEAIRRVESRLAAWQKCAADYQASNPGEAAQQAVQRAYDGIVEHRNQWLAATRRYASKQSASNTRPNTGANGIAAAWDDRNAHDMAPHIKSREPEAAADDTRQP